MEEQIINYIRECPWMYDASRDDFRDAEKKQNSWRRLGDILHMDVADLKKKWKNLRSSFVREKKIPASGSAGGQKKQWVYMEAMSFLHPYVREKKRTYTNYSLDVSHTETDPCMDMVDVVMNLESNIEHEFEDSLCVEGAEDSTMLQSTPQTTFSNGGKQITDALFLTKKNKRKRQNDIFIESLEATDSMLKKILTEEKDDDEMFCQVLKSHLKNVKHHKKLDIHIKILQLVKEEINKETV